MYHSLGNSNEKRKTEREKSQVSNMTVYLTSKTEKSVSSNNTIWCDHVDWNYFSLKDIKLTYRYPTLSETKSETSKKKGPDLSKLEMEIRVRWDQGTQYLSRPSKSEYEIPRVFELERLLRPEVKHVWNKFLGGSWKGSGCIWWG